MLNSKHVALQAPQQTSASEKCGATQFQFHVWTTALNIGQSNISLLIKRRLNIKRWQKYPSLRDQLALARLNYENSFFSIMVSSCPGSPQALNPPLPQMWLPAVSFEESSGDFTAGRWCLCSCNESGPNVFLLPPWAGESQHVCCCCCCCCNMRRTFHQDCIFLQRLQHLNSLCDHRREWEGGWRGENKVASSIPAGSWLQTWTLVRMGPDWCQLPKSLLTCQQQRRHCCLLPSLEVLYEHFFGLENTKRKQLSVNNIV